MEVEERSHQGYAWWAAEPRGSAGGLYPSPSLLPAAVGVMGLPKRGLEVIISLFLCEGSAPALLEVNCLVAAVLGGGKDWLIQRAGCSTLLQIREMSNQILQISSNGNPPCHLNLVAGLDLKHFF